MRKIASRGAEGKNKHQIIGKIRIGSLNKLFAYRYGGGRCEWQFPDDDAGIEDLKILLHHYRFTFPHKLPKIVKLRAPWADSDKVLEEISAYPKLWKSERLGQILNFTGEEWRRLRIRIAPVDMTKEERRYYSNVLAEGKRLKKRRMEGMTTRDEYLAANSLSRDEPWVAEGISRATWFRRQKKNRAETSLPAIHTNALARPVSQGWIGHEGKSPNSREWVSGDGTPPTQLPASPDPSSFNPILSWLCLRAAYHQQMSRITDEIANLEDAA
jgi:hypothetical protein